MISAFCQRRKREKSREPRREMGEFLKSLFGKKDEPVAVAPASAAEQSAAQTAAQTAAPAAEPLHVTDDTFAAAVLGSALPTLVDFWAPWCGPCRMVAPIVDELAQAYQGRAVVAKMNTDENAETPAGLGIMGIPTLILFKDGQEVDRVVGYAPRRALEEKLNAVLN
jgi:thioredoxin 1